MSCDPFAELEKELPPFVTRTLASEKLGGLIAPGTLANLDSEGRGPDGRVVMGGKVAYPRTEFVAWVRRRSVVSRGACHV